MKPKFVLLLVLFIVQFNTKASSYVLEPEENDVPNELPSFKPARQISSAEQALPDDEKHIQTISKPANGLGDNESEDPPQARRRRGNSHGCYNQHCWSHCALGWCYTKDIRRGNNYVICDDDSECKQDWACKGACSIG